MFGLGFQEIVVIAILALVLLGPKKLPELARTLGKFMRDFQRAADDVKREINETVEDARKSAGGAPHPPQDTPKGPIRPDPSAEVYGIATDGGAKEPEAVGIPRQAVGDAPKGPGPAPHAG
jgi:Tat protein translocase TatB subunit